MKIYKIVGWLLILWGAFGILDLIYKIIYNQADAIHRGNITGVIWLIVGIVLIIKSRKSVDKTIN